MSTAMPTQTADATDVRTLRNYVGGRFVEAATSEHLDVTEPATGALLARVPLSSAADLDAAVRAAQEAFPPGGARRRSSARGACSRCARRWSRTRSTSRA